MELAKTYAPGEIESKWYPIWEEKGYFKPNMDKSAPSYCIQLPPPNVTGTLHMGHAFQQTIMDILIRYHRMKGYNTLWQAGTDHAGIATQIVVERQLDAIGVSRHDLGREEFIKRVWDWKKISGDTITRQMRRLGASCDWSRERFTMDEGLSKAVSEVFVSLYQKGYIYRGKRLVNWDIQLQTAVSDLEVVSEEENGSLWHIRYPVKDSNESIVVATTRPETMLGDVAVAINPEDERYKHLIGKTLILPLVGREIPIIIDDYVDASFGTGCVKITPAHDFNDYDIGKRHNLPMISVLTLDGKINENAPTEYQGMERFAARKQVVADLEAQGYLVEIKPHKLMVPRGDRTNVVIEPMLTDQWFMAMDKFAARGLELVEFGKIKFVPENWKKTYDQWLTNIQDWCISRQLWWGHRIPAFYDDKGNVFVAKTLEEATQQAGTNALTQDNDVLDTWFSSALWCFSTLDWPQDNDYLKAFLPSNVLVTGFDIIFFWVARMIMLTEEFTGEVPFKDIYINGLIMDAHGEKMSKSKGNIIDPLDIINGISIDELVKKRTANLMNPKQAEKIAKQTQKDYPDGFTPFGADALRFSLATLATQARYINFDLKRIEGNRNFCNKIFNATKFVLMQVENHQELIASGNKKSLIDQWILSELAKLISDVENGFASYRFDLASQRIYEFVWNELCDWYLELAKVNLQSEDKEIKAGTIDTLLTVLEAVLRIMHPIMPFLTEELWQVVAPLANKKAKESIVISNYPQKEDYVQSNQSQIDGFISQLKNLIGVVRNLRAEMNIQPAVKVPLFIETSNPDEYSGFVDYIKMLAKIETVSIVAKLEDSQAPVAVIQGGRLMLKVEIDIAAEKSRLTKEIEKNTKEIEKMKVKLDNPNYALRAPAELVAKDQARVSELNAIVATLTQQLAKLS
jgi:valyl-tRNA synthetase